MSIANFFIPGSHEISAITNANPGVVTTTQEHGYETDYEVRFFFPLDVGMNQLKDKVVTITVIDDTNFSIDVDTTLLDVFSPVGTSQLPQVIPVGSFTDRVVTPTDNGETIIPEN